MDPRPGDAAGRDRSRPPVVVLAGVMLAVVVGQGVFLLLSWDAPAPPGAEGGSGSTAAGSATAFVLTQVDYLATGIVALVLVARRPENTITWLWLAASVGLPLNDLGFGVTRWSLVTPVIAPAVTALAAWVAQWAWTLTVLVIPYLLLLFPDGRLPGRRWRWLLRAAVAHTLVTVALLMFSPGPLDLVPSLANPVGLPVLPHLGTAGGLPPQLGVLFSLIPVFVVGGLAALAMRYRRADGVQRRQILVLVYAATTYGLVSLGGDVVLPEGLVGIVTNVAGMGFTLALAVAVLRYRLYEIDRVISRTATYAVVTAVLVGVYALVAVVPAAVFALDSDLLVAAATLVAAAAFGPVRRRVQSAVDRRFDRARYDAQQVVEAFGARLRDELAIADLRADLCRVVDRSMQPSRVSVWIPEGRS